MAQSHNLIVQNSSVNFIIDKLYISYPEPFPQAVVWPSYPQQALHSNQHLLMPSMAAQIQPPPLTPLQLLGTDYMGSTTLHQVFRKTKHIFLKH